MHTNPFYLMDFPIHIDRISKRFVVLYLKGSQVEVSSQCILSLKFVLILAKSAYPDEMQHHAAFHLALHCLPK